MKSTNSCPMDSEFRQASNTSHLRRGILNALTWCSVVLPTGLIAQPSRHISNEQLESMWSRGGGRDDTLFASPVRIALTQSHAVVLDQGRGRVVGLNLSNGTVGWVFDGGRVANGMSSAVAITAISGNRIAVADDRTNQLLIVDRNGGLVKVVPIPSTVRPISSVCEVSSGLYLIGSLHPLDMRLALVDESGTIKGRMPSPFQRNKANLRAPAPNMRAALDQFDLYGAEGICVAAQRLGNRFATFQNGVFSEPRDYVVRSRNFSQARTQGDFMALPITQRAGALLRGALMISSGIAHGDSTNIIDIYDPRTGAYQRSVRYPRNIGYFAVSGVQIVILHGASGKPAVTSFRTRY